MIIVQKQKDTERNAQKYDAFIMLIGKHQNADIIAVMTGER